VCRSGSQLAKREYRFDPTTTAGTIGTPASRAIRATPGRNLAPCTTDSASARIRPSGNIATARPRSSRSKIIRTVAGSRRLRSSGKAFMCEKNHATSPFWKTSVMLTKSSRRGVCRISSGTSYGLV